MALASVVVGGEDDRLSFCWNDTGDTRVSVLSQDRNPVHISLSKAEVHALLLWCQDVRLLNDELEEDGELITAST